MPHLTSRRVFRVLCALLIGSVMLAGAVRAEYASEALERAIGLVANGDTKSAQNIIRPLAESGNPRAQHFMAKMLSAGQGVA